MRPAKRRVYKMCFSVLSAPYSGKTCLHHARYPNGRFPLCGIPSTAAFLFITFRCVPVLSYSFRLLVDNWIMCLQTGSPSFKSDMTCDENSGWVCEHRWPAIRNMALFRSVTSGTGVNNIQTSDNCIAFSRGNKGFFALNNGYNTWSTSFQTGLPAGSYCDVIRWENRDRRDQIEIKWSYFKQKCTAVCAIYNLQSVTIKTDFTIF